MRIGLTICLSVLLAAGTTLPAAAQSLHIKGKFGFLSEYEFAANVAAASGGKEFSGPLVVRHVGLCTHEGPPVKEGQISLQFTGAKRVNATLNFDGRACTYRGTLSETDINEMKCPESSSALPSSLWSK
jgi:hypothetical protein